MADQWGAQRAFESAVHDIGRQVMRRTVAARSGALVLVAAASVLVGACGGPQPGAPGGGPVVAVLTQPPPMTDACMTALLTGTLVPHAQTGLAVRSGAHVQRVMWPHGYWARAGSRGLELLNSTGTLVAREGESISMGGGEIDGVWHACG